MPEKNYLGHPKKLEARSLRMLLKRPMRPDDELGVLADRCFVRHEVKAAIAFLLAKLEVGAYAAACAAKIFGSPKECPPFKIHRYLGTTKAKQSAEFVWGSSRRSLALVDPDSYERCAKLYGARDEVLHFNLPAFRKFDGENAKHDRNDLYHLYVEHYVEFRRAVDAALRWMGVEP